MFTPSVLQLPALVLGLCLGLTTSFAWPTSPAAAETLTPEPTNGTYLYGESATADQLGQGYVVFSQKNGRVVGALYHPSSEFSCFSGAIANQQLQVISYGMGEGQKVALQMPLNKMYAIPALTEMSKNSLAVCEQEIAALENGQLRAEKP